MLVTRYAIRLATAIALLVAMPSIAAWLTPIASLAVFFAAFSLTHDVAHGALGLPRRANDIVLALGGLAIGTSGHALRLMHMRHHARPLAPDDYEGAAARMTARRAALASPRLSRALHAAAWRAASPRERRIQLAEYCGLAALVLGLAFGPLWLATHAAIAFAMQAMAPLWAGYVPHRTPRLVAAIARALSAARLQVPTSLAFHDVHHRHPKIPTDHLRAAALRDALHVHNFTTAMSRSCESVVRPFSVVARATPATPAREAGSRARTGRVVDRGFLAAS